jgi:glycosyltransferase involved in cell wall biosynthesis
MTAHHSADHRLADKFDAVIMLTWSDWKTEPRSNRYHYASRFCQELPVYFVQPDAPPDSGRLEKTELPNVTIVHSGPHYGRPQSLFIETLLADLGVRRPLIWVYNVFFSDFILRHTNQMIVYHATEDYLGKPDEMFLWGDMSHIITHFGLILPKIDLLISVAKPICRNFIQRGRYTGPAIVVTNGCDEKFWRGQHAYDFVPLTSGRMAFYQGAINSRLNYDLLTRIIDAMPDWQFWFCGEVVETESWSELLRRSNVRYLGVLSPEGIAAAARKASVGMVPFVDRHLMRISVPLKCYEYIACGLPVVSSPNDALSAGDGLVTFASTADEFVEAMRRTALTRNDPIMLQQRLTAAAAQSYDKKFNDVCEELGRVHSALKQVPRPLNVCVICSPPIDTKGVAKLSAIKKRSRHKIYYLQVTRGDRATAFSDRHQWDLNWFDALAVEAGVITTCGRMKGLSLRHAIHAFDGPRLLLITDSLAPTKAEAAATFWKFDTIVKTSRENLGEGLADRIDQAVDAGTIKPAKIKVVETPRNASMRSERNILVWPNDWSLAAHPDDPKWDVTTDAATINATAELASSMVREGRYFPSRFCWLRIILFIHAMRFAISLSSKLPRPLRNQMTMLVPERIREWLRVYLR